MSILSVHFHPSFFGLLSRVLGADMPQGICLRSFEWSDECEIPDTKSLWDISAIFAFDNSPQHCSCTSPPCISGLPALSTKAQSGKEGSAFGIYRWVLEGWKLNERRYTKTECTTPRGGKNARHLVAALGLEGKNSYCKINCATRMSKQIFPIMVWLHESTAISNP